MNVIKKTIDTTNNSFKLENILNNIKILKKNPNINLSFKRTLLAIKYLNKKSEYTRMQIAKFHPGRSFHKIYECYSKFKNNINNYFIEQVKKKLIKQEKCSLTDSEEYVKKISIQLKKEYYISISKMFINKSSLFRKILRRHSRGKFFYNKKNFINLYFVLKYKKKLK